MDLFTEGEEVRHKATRARCVIIHKNANGSYTVRDEHNELLDYFPQELEKEQPRIINRKRGGYLY